jgi:hypothetical protein
LRELLAKLTGIDEEKVTTKEIPKRELRDPGTEVASPLKALRLPVTTKEIPKRELRDIYNCI